MIPILSEAIHAIQVDNPFNATHSIVIQSSLTKVTSYFAVGKPPSDEHDGLDIPKIDLQQKLHHGSCPTLISARWGKYAGIQGMICHPSFGKGTIIY